MKVRSSSTHRIPKRYKRRKETGLTLAIEEIEHSIPAKALCPTKSASLTYLLPVPNRKPADQGAIQEATLASTRVLSFRVENRLPANIRLNDILPPVVATLRGLDPADDDDPPYASMWGRISLMSADGRVAMAQIAPDILLGTVLTPFQPPNDGDWSLVFAGLKIRRPGYYRLHVALMQTSQRESEDGGPPIVEAPRELLGAATDLIHVHSFAPERHEWVS